MKSAWFVLAALLALSAANVFAFDSSTPKEHRRGPEQTYLTFPEWFLVFSPAEFAAFTKENDPSDFPFLGHVRQFWGSYASVTRATLDDRFVFNGGYHVMIMVIGVSTTVEYAIRSAYETIIGRLAELTTAKQTDEDIYAARMAQEYVDFIRVRPWYEFDFWSRLKRLWSDIPWSGDGMLRKWERRYMLTTEFLVKAGYGWLIERGTHASYDRPLTTTAVVLDQAVDGSTLTLLPRYEAFTPAATQLAKQGFNFVEIAGNDKAADILISVLIDTNTPLPVEARLLFQQPIITVPGRRRAAFVVSVDALSPTLRDLNARGVTIEHVFDY